MTNPVVNFLLRYARKATGAFLLALAGAIGTNLLDGDITQAEIAAGFGVALLAAGSVFKLENKGIANPLSRNKAVRDTARLGL